VRELPTAISIATYFIRPLARAVEELGGDSTEIRALLTDSNGKPRDRMPRAEAIAAWERGVDRTGSRSLGLRAAQLIEAGNYGVLEFGARTSPTLGMAFQRVARYHRLLNDVAEMPIVEQGEVCSIGYRMPAGILPLPPSFLEFIIGSWVTLGQQLCESNWMPRAVHLPHPAPDDPAMHHTVLGEHVVFSAASTELVVSRAVFDMPLLNADPALCALLDGHAEALVKGLSSSESWTQKVEHFVASELADGGPRLDEVAKGLNTTARTLRRRLADEGGPYAQLLDGIRKRIALQFLDGRRGTAIGAAFVVGFSEPSAFHRAFKRWTGTTPQKYLARSK